MCVVVEGGAVGSAVVRIGVGATDRSAVTSAVGTGVRSGDGPAVGSAVGVGVSGAAVGAELVLIAVALVRNAVVLAPEDGALLAPQHALHVTGHKLCKNNKRCRRRDQQRQAI